MNGLRLIIPLVWLGSTAAAQLPAKSEPAASPGKVQTAHPGDGTCCCDEEMRRMMREMMQKRSSQVGSPTEPRPSPASPSNEHDH